MKHKKCDNEAPDIPMIRALKTKFVMINVCFVAFILGIILFAVGMNSYGQRLGTIEETLNAAAQENAVVISFISHTQDGMGKLAIKPGSPSDLAEEYHDSGWEYLMDSLSGNSSEQKDPASNSTNTDNEEKTENKNQNEGTSSTNTKVPEIGTRDNSKVKNYIPVVTYSLNENTKEITPVIESAALASGTLPKMSDELFSAKEGMHRSNIAPLYFYKKDTPQGMRVAFTDASYVDDYVKGMIESFGLTTLVTLIAVAIMSIILSRWVSNPIAEAWKRQTRFVADASHELKTPISVIMANTALMTCNPDQKVEDIRQWIDSTSEEAENMQSLVSDMLFLAAGNDRIASQSKNEKTDLTKAAGKTVLSFESLAFEKKLTISEEIEPGLSMPIPEKDLSKILTILMDNAVKYSTPGTEIKVKTEKRGRKTEVSITNKGETISKEDLECIFDRFFRSDKARTREGGYGLGLAIAKDIATSNSASLTAESSEENGTVFKLSI